jgi:hypothetical protein
VIVYPQTALGDSSVHVISIIDSSRTDLTVTSIHHSQSAFTVSAIAPFIVPGNSSSAVRIAFKPTAYGAYADTLAIYSDGGSATVVLSGQSPVPTITVVPSSLQFGSIAQYDSLLASLRITNTSVNPLRLDSIRTSTTSFVARPSGAIIRQTDTLVVTVVFRPQIVGGIVDSLRLYSNAPPGVVKVPVSGSGRASTILHARARWDLLSIPRTPATGNPDVLLPGKVGQAYLFDPSSQVYSAATTLAPGPGFWVFFGGDTTISFTGTVVDSLTVSAPRQGWVLVGARTAPTPLNAVVFNPPDALVGAPYRFDATLQSYVQATTFVPTQGHWLYVSKPCTITLRSQ